MLFLTDVDHVSFEKVKGARQNNLQSATVSLQVVIGLYKLCLLYDGFFLLPSSGRWYLYLVAD